MIILLLRNSISRSPLRGFLLIMVALARLTLSPAAQAELSPPPDGGYLNGNTAEGDRALFNLNPLVGRGNTAVGELALGSDATGSYNTAVGDFALVGNTTGYSNTAVGNDALFKSNGSANTATGAGALYINTGDDNTATGAFALGFSNTGHDNTATGFEALSNNTGYFNTATGANALHSNTGQYNTATGANALYSNTGFHNVANGIDALYRNTTGSRNTATGDSALTYNATGSSNTATGVSALFFNTTGSNNIALGSEAGFIITGSNNIDIGNQGVAGDDSKIRIGVQGTQNATFVAGIFQASVGGNNLPVVVDNNGQLGTMSSSRRFKKEIKPMDQTSQAILGLKPVTFQYKSDASGTAQFGLIAEEVAKVDPDLVVRDAEGEIYSVRYEAVNAMLLNEFLKEHRKVQELEAIVAQQHKGMEVLAAQLKEQASQIQKVSAQLELNKPAPQMVVNNQ